MVGVYGGHAKEGGLNDQILDAHFAEKRAEREARGDFGAQDELKRAIGYVKDAETTHDVRYAEIILARAGMLAVKEALFHGKVIKGWEGELPSSDLLSPANHVSEDDWFFNRHLSHIESLPDRYQVVANLADNPWLRKIRQTGGPLPPDRELRFARARVEALRRELEEEEAELQILEQGWV